MELMDVVTIRRPNFSHRLALMLNEGKYFIYHRVLPNYLGGETWERSIMRVIDLGMKSYSTAHELFMAYNVVQTEQEAI